MGLGLKEVPDAIGKHLWSLKSLSLSSNALEEIPDGLCDLTALTELNLVRNKLRTLPDRCEEGCHSGGEPVGRFTTKNVASIRQGSTKIER